METMATAILAALGGESNIVRITNCMTRLRIVLKSTDRADTAALRKIDGVQGVLHSADQLQIVIGPGKVQQVADRVNALVAATRQAQPDAVSAPASPAIAVTAPTALNTTEAAALTAKAVKQSMKAKQQQWIHRFLSKFATIFTPLIPGFLAAGLLLGFATLIEQTALASTLHPLTAFMKVFAKGLFAFLGILVGYNAQQAFGGSGVNGAILGSLFLLDYSGQAKGPFAAGLHDFLGWPIDPRGSLIGILIAAIVGAQIEKQVRKRMPPNLDMFLTSLVTLLIGGAVTYLVIMPIGVQLFDGMSWLFSHLNNNPLGAAVLSGLFLVAVVFGVHQGFIPVYFALVEKIGFNTLFPILSMAGAGQVGAALALYAKASKTSNLRRQVKGTIVPALLGVGEPLIYGVMLPRLTPFITACLGGALGGFVIGLVAWMNFPIGLNTVFGPSLTSRSGPLPAIGIYLAGLISAYLGGFLFTYFWGSRNVNLD
jgi:N-acetylmuramic acid-specific PTS system IIC component